LQRATRFASSVVMTTKMFVKRLIPLIFMLIVSPMGGSSGGVGEFSFNIWTKQKFVGRKGRFCWHHFCFRCKEWNVVCRIC